MQLSSSVLALEVPPPDTIDVSWSDTFWSARRPLGIDERVLVLGVPMQGVKSVQFDPATLTLWVVSEGPTDEGTARLFKGTNSDSNEFLLAAQETSLVSQTVSQVCLLPGRRRHLVVVEKAARAYIWYDWSDPESGCLRLPNGICHIELSRSGTRLAYGLSNGNVGVLTLSNGILSSCPLVDLEDWMTERTICGDHADGWSFSFNAAHDRLYFLRINRFNRLTGWFDLPSGRKRFLQPPFEGSLPDWAFDVSAAHDGSSQVCFVGCSRHCHVLEGGTKKPRIVAIAGENYGAGYGPCVEQVHFERRDFALLRTKREIMAINLQESTDDLPCVLGNLPAPEGMRLLDVGICKRGYNSTVYIVVAPETLQPKPAGYSEDRCYGK